MNITAVNHSMELTKRGLAEEQVQINNSMFSFLLHEGTGDTFIHLSVLNISLVPQG